MEESIGAEAEGAFRDFAGPTFLHRGPRTDAGCRRHRNLAGGWVPVRPRIGAYVVAGWLWGIIPFST